MVAFRFALWGNKKISFWKLFGCGKNGTFDKHPDLRQWALLLVLQSDSIDDWQQQIPSFIQKWWRFFSCETFSLLLEPISGHGSWDGKQVFGNLSKDILDEEKICVLTRATIRISKLKNFWRNVPPVAAQMHHAEGLIFSIGIGELPLLKQATCSVWENTEAMKAFAYKMYSHAEVIKKTREEKWYKEEMFVRFTIQDAKGSIAGLYDAHQLQKFINTTVQFVLIVEKCMFFPQRRIFN